MNSFDQIKAEEEPTGRLDILNCGHGHLEITFIGHDPVEVERSKRIITDMLKRGYALFVHGTDGALIRVQEFSDKYNAYVIADGPTVPAVALPAEATPDIKPKKDTKRRAVPITQANATVVGKSAGG